MTTSRYIFNSININGGIVGVDCPESNTISVDIRGTFVGTMQFEASMNGDDWFAVPMVPAASGSQTATVASAASAGAWTGSVASAVKFRVRASAWTSGTANIQMRASETTFPYVFISGATSLTATVTSAVLAPSATVGGFTTTHHLISAATTNATSVKASAGTVGMLVLSNSSAAVKYFKLYNKASAPTVGTDTPVMTVLVPAGQTISIDLTQGLRLSIGIAYALTGGITVADTTAVALNDLAVHITYI